VWRVFILLALLVGVGLAAGETTPVAAFDPFSCPRRLDIRPVFVGSEWSQSYTWENGGVAKPMDLVNVAISNWRNDTRDDFGNPIFDNGSGATPVTFQFTTGGDSGATSCANRTITVNRNILGNGTFNLNPSGFVGVMAHEIGHWYGLNHAGKFDSHMTVTGHLPLMSTCLTASEENNRNIVINDDAAAAEYLLSDIAGPSLQVFDSATANSSFENGGAWWAGSLSIIAGGANSTPAAARMPANSTMYSRSRVHKGLNSDVTNGRAKVRAWVKAPSSGSGVIVRYFRRGVTWPDTSSSCFGADNKNASATASAWIYVDNPFVVVSTSWAVVETPYGGGSAANSNLPNGGSDDDPDAQEVQVQVYNNRSTTLDVDLARVLYDFN
jgi:hypothetical protein